MIYLGERSTNYPEITSGRIKSYLVLQSRALHFEKKLRLDRGIEAWTLDAGKGYSILCVEVKVIPKIILTSFPDEDGPTPGVHFASGDEKFDRETCADIWKELEVNDWAWCIVRIEARWRQHSGDNYLGGCSYEDEEDFRRGGYLKQMIEDATADLISNIKTARHGPNARP